MTRLAAAILIVILVPSCTEIVDLEPLGDAHGVVDAAPAGPDADPVTPDATPVFPDAGPSPTDAGVPDDAF